MWQRNRMHGPWGLWCKHKAHKIERNMSHIVRHTHNKQRVSITQYRVSNVTSRTQSPETRILSTVGHTLTNFGQDTGVEWVAVVDVLVNDLTLDLHTPQSRRLPDWSVPFLLEQAPPYEELWAVGKYPSRSNMSEHVWTSFLILHAVTKTAQLHNNQRSCVVISELRVDQNPRHTASHSGGYFQFPLKWVSGRTSANTECMLQHKLLRHVHFSGDFHAQNQEQRWERS